MDRFSLEACCDLVDFTRTKPLGSWFFRKDSANITKQCSPIGMRMHSCQSGKNSTDFLSPALRDRPPGLTIHSFREVGLFLFLAVVAFGGENSDAVIVDCIDEPVCRVDST